MLLYEVEYLLQLRRYKLKNKYWMVMDWKVPQKVDMSSIIMKSNVQVRKKMEIFAKMIL